MTQQAVQDRIEEIAQALREQSSQIEQAEGNTSSKEELSSLRAQRKILQDERNHLRDRDKRNAKRRAKRASMDASEKARHCEADRH